MAAFVPTVLQATALLVTSLLAGSMFGIWRGYDPALFSPSTFVEVHQGAVRGLNTLLPAMGLAAIVLCVLLAGLGRQRPMVLALYLAGAAALVAAGLITRFANQPINDIIMAWAPASPPESWTGLRDSWWSWHVLRLAAAIGGEVLLIAAVFADREG